MVSKQLKSDGGDGDQNETEGATSPRSRCWTGPGERGDLTPGVTPTVVAMTGTGLGRATMVVTTTVQTTSRLVSPP